MNINILRLLILYLLLYTSTLCGQNLDLETEIQDTVELRQIVHSIITKEKIDTNLDQDKIHEIQKLSLEMKDTSTFFYLTYYTFYQYIDNYPINKSLDFCKSSQEILGTEKTKYGDLNNELGSGYALSGYNLEAIDYYFKSVEWFEEFDEMHTNLPFGNIALLFFKIENYEKALHYNELALSYSLKQTNLNNRRYNLIFNYYGIGAVYHKLEDFIKAEEFYIKSLKIAEEHNDYDMSFVAISEALKFYSDIKQYDTCDSLIHIADELLKNREVNNSPNEKVYKLERSKHYLSTGQIGKASKPSSISFEWKENKVEHLNYNIDYFNDKKQYNNSVLHYSQLLEIYELENLERSKNAISNIEEKYINKKLIKENESLITEVEKRSEAFFKGMILLAILTAVLLLQVYNNIRFKKINTSLISKTNDLKSTNLELERFSFLAAHDLKTPLRSIVSFTSLLEKKLGDHKNLDVHEYITYIKESGIAMNNLIDSTLDYSKHSNSAIPNKKEEVDLNVIVFEVEEFLSGFIAEKNASIVILNDLPTLNSERLSLFQLFQNLIENGIKYNESSQPTISISSINKENWRIVYIKDNGIGIPEEYQAKVFDMFARLHNKNDYTGSGLGLSICKRIIEKIGGKIDLSNNSDLGCTIEIKLPLAIKKY